MEKRIEIWKLITRNVEIKPTVTGKKRKELSVNEPGIRLDRAEGRASKLEE